MLGERAIERCDSAGLVAARRGEEPPATGDARERPLTVEPHGALFDPVKQLARFL